MQTFASPTPSQIWTAALGELQLQVARPSYDTFLQGTSGLALHENTLTVSTPNPFVAEYLEKKLYFLIQKTVEGVARRPIKVEFRVATHTTGSLHRDSSGQATSSYSRSTSFRGARPLGSPINPRHSFKRFIVGESNHLAHAAAVAACRYPGQKYNPVFLYSGVGLGKTHLLHAIGLEAQRKGLKVAYLSAEQFTSEFISAIRDGHANAFRTKYRSVDMLLLDDVQFLAGKEQTQEGFFHTFNDLHDSNRQIVITSDRAPQSLTLLEDRLRSRFEWGLLADIQPPGLETRLAIVNSKASLLGVKVAEPVQELIARRPHRSVRELEGHLNRVVAYAELTGRPISVETAGLALADIIPTRVQRRPSPQEVVSVVADRYGLEEAALRGPRRDQRTALARHVAMFLLREELHLSLADVGKTLGGWHHSSVIHGCRRIRLQTSEQTALREDLTVLRQRLDNTSLSVL